MQNLLDLLKNIPDHLPEQDEFGVYRLSEDTQGRLIGPVIIPSECSPGKYIAGVLNYGGLFLMYLQTPSGGFACFDTAANALEALRRAGLDC